MVANKKDGSKRGKSRRRLCFVLSRDNFPGGLNPLFEGGKGKQGRKKEGVDDEEDRFFVLVR